MDPAQQDHEQKSYDPNHENAGKAIIVYGTASGNAELVTDAIAEGMREAGLDTATIRGERANPAEVAQYGLIVMLSPTYNVGKLQEYLEPYYAQFRKLKLTGKKMAVVGLGDSKNYDIFCGAAEVLEEVLAEVGGLQIVPTLRVDGPPHNRLSEYKTWGINLANVYHGN